MTQCSFLFYFSLNDSYLNWNEKHNFLASKHIMICVIFLYRLWYRIPFELNFGLSMIWKICIFFLLLFDIRQQPRYTHIQQCNKQMCTHRHAHIHMRRINRTTITLKKENANCQTTFKKKKCFLAFFFFFIKLFHLIVL